MTLHRFHLPSAGPGSMELPEAAFIHVTRVLRLHEGDALHVFDAGLEFAATIAAIEKNRVRIDVGAVVPSLPERGTPLHLIMSPLKGDLTELVIQKATELGAGRISPTVFDRTDNVARRVPGEARLDRWRRVAVSAAEQSGRTVVPVLDSLATLREALGALGEPREEEIRLVAAEPSLGLAARGESRVASQARDFSSDQGDGPKEYREYFEVQQRRAGGKDPLPTRPDFHRGLLDGRGMKPAGSARSLVVAVGPAGGLSPGDLTLLGPAGFRPERLAVHTLRSETACIAAVAILGHRFP